IIHHINSLLPFDIAVKNILPVINNAHARFDARNRSYEYIIHQHKNPLLFQRSYYFPYLIDWDILQKTARYILAQTEFIGFSKLHTQVNNFHCQILKSQWSYDKEQQVFKYDIVANRFLRGMVKALVATQLEVASHKLSMQALEALFQNPLPAKGKFNAPSYGLYLTNITYPKEIFTSMA
ncbi:unnamed protein product, partial [Staurois parvus]